MPEIFFNTARPAVPVAGGPDFFAVRRIFCVGQNYAAHAREMGSDPERARPFYFSKPADAIVQNGGTVPYPSRCNDLHHEIELVVAIGKAGRDISAEVALQHVFGYAVGIDLTRRDLQAQAKKNGKPWDTAKGFDYSAPMSSIHPASDIGHPESGRIWLEVNGRPRQDGDLRDLIWSVPEAIAELSSYFELRPGDLLFTGTPSGVGPVSRGDSLAGGVAGVDEISVSIGN
ncbi:MAG: fumarylacetoacetate hydrolase family protein [Gammaproteobacteria bacterium]|nr:fumarylacetoacetate hydrolase family protein [Gammaproteobacteria bacterium]